METIEKYSRTEYERRWIVPPDAEWLNLVEPYSKHLHDRYIDGSRLRLRHQVDTDSGREEWKLAKKYHSESPFQRLITSIVLDGAEAKLISRVPAHEIKKTRFYDTFDDGLFAIDVFEDELAGLTICEIEGDDLGSIMRISPPSYAGIEVTENDFFAGGNLCRITAIELKQKLGSIL